MSASVETSVVMGIDRAIQQYRKGVPLHQKHLPSVPPQNSSIEPDRPTRKRALPPPWLATSPPASKYRKLDSSTSVPVIKKQQAFASDEKGKPMRRMPPQQNVVTTTATSVAKREAHGTQPNIQTLITQTTRFQNGDVKRSLWYDPMALQQEDELADYQFALQVAKKLYKK